jgi:ABC-type glycerol-3-phosphate transport system substrate-binding protein
MRRASRLIACAAGALVIAACGGSSGGDQPSSATTVTATQKEFSIELTASSATAGRITFRTVNSGALPHELKAVKTDLAPDKLPMDGAKVDEGKVDVAAKIDQVAAGKTADADFTLSSGRYVLICNVEGHYAAGMHVAFSVQ